VIGLQFLGPPASAVAGRAGHDAPGAGDQARAGQDQAGQDQPASARATPARAVATQSDPAPASRMDLTAIPEPDPALQEPSEFAGRLLPRIDATGRSPASLYAAAFDPAERHPRIALVIDGAGLDRGLTIQANRTLPAAIDLAFSAYAPQADAGRIARDARRLGRECLVSVPMEPNGFPAAEEGDRSLLTGSDATQSRANLEWALSNVQGCVGATGASDGLAGERFAESRQAFADMLATIAQHGLFYLDPRPGAPAPADTGAIHVSPYVVDVVVDASAASDQPADAEAIDHNLAMLEQIAARRGAAIGLAGPPTPVLLDRLAVWSHGLAARGMVLAPLTAMPRPK
jgi:polysaccharide deacetylase 2 family uncharacterized protein YibQ